MSGVISLGAHTAELRGAQEEAPPTPCLLVLEQRPDRTLAQLAHAPPKAAAPARVHQVG